jgi:putative nucleotidyltransferase with HDIG domain
MEDRIHEIESYVRRSMSTVTAPDLRIGHDFKHVDRVRGWALRIASSEAVQDLELVEAAALLHDIGLTRVEVDQRGQHAQVGAEIAGQFLHEHQMFTEDEIGIITDAIRCHSSPRGGGRLGEVLRDADKLDALGAVGIMRAFTSKYAKPEYAPQDVRGDTWGMPMSGFEARFAAGEGIGDHIIDQINLQISFYGELHTPTARQIGKPLVEFVKAYVIQLDSEIRAAQMPSQQEPSKQRVQRRG